LFCLGSIISLALSSYFETFYGDFFNSLTRSAYLKVFRVFYEDPEEGDTFPIITVRQKPIKESFNTIVNLEPRNGV
jgi:hypothetical protein